MDEVEKKRRIKDFDADERITELQRALQAKNVEMREIHHRVKNNLAVIASLLSLSARAAESNEAKQAIEEARDRVATMTAVYERLQASDNNEQVNMHALVTSIVSQYGFREKGVSASFNISEDMVLPAKQAIPCAQILNELVSNAFKHAFPDGRQGWVKVEMARIKGKMALDLRVKESNDIVELIVSDNGIGLPKWFNFFSAKSMGMEITRSLILQLDGKVCRNSDNRGTKITIRFSV